jgi:hypothetical protein
MPDYNKYFKKFPIIEYANTQAINLLARVKILDSVFKNPFVYYPYQVKDGDRPDSISHKYYEDSYMSWLVYHANKVVDPYYDWALDQDQFNRFIVEKYGSMSAAIRKTLHYRVDWSDDEQRITPSYYENTLSESGKKYFTGEFAPNGRVIAYKRKELDWTMNTNFCLKLAITLSGNTEFTNNEVLTIRTATNTNLGSCETVRANSTILIVRHIEVEHEDFQLDGDTFTAITPNTNFSVIGDDSTAVANISTYTILQRNIPIDEIPYWSRVSYFDYEEEQNNDKKSIYLLDSKFAEQTTEELKILLKD